MRKQKEMSKIDRLIPRFFKGYDMDILLEKMNKHKLLTEKEKAIISEVQDIYYSAYFKENHDRLERIRQNNLENGMFLGLPSINYCGGPLTDD